MYNSFLKVSLENNFKLKSSENIRNGNQGSSINLNEYNQKRRFKVLPGGKSTQLNLKTFCIANTFFFP